jgi:hypothetical protein
MRLVLYDVVVRNAGLLIELSRLAAVRPPSDRNTDSIAAAATAGGSGFAESSFVRHTVCGLHCVWSAKLYGIYCTGATPFSKTNAYCSQRLGFGSSLFVSRSLRIAGFLSLYGQRMYSEGILYENSSGMVVSLDNGLQLKLAGSH